MRATYSVSPALPILAQAEVSDETRWGERAEKAAERLAREQPDLRLPDELRSVAASRLGAAPALHLDDLSGVRFPVGVPDYSYLGDRARLRAGDDDIVASQAAPDAAFERYCERQLLLGRARWLRPRSVAGRVPTALGCWSDREVRKVLVRALRRGGLKYIHPHMGTRPVWELAILLHRATRRPVQVIAPPPRLVERVNHKIWFVRTSEALFGRPVCPPTTEAWNLATLARFVHAIAGGSERIVLKIPDSAGGVGNLVLETSLFRGADLESIERDLGVHASCLGWTGRHRLLVSTWESDVHCAPSCQLWIPPEADGLPVVEGVFRQTFAPSTATFVGMRPVELPAAVAREIVDRCWTLARMYQRLGWVGRCSFDLLLVGRRPEAARVEFVECNGRWGGTSVPMLLLNRLLGDWTARPFEVRGLRFPGLDRVSFADLLAAFGDEAYDARTGRGRLVFFNPGKLRVLSGIDLIAVADTPEEVQRCMETIVPERLRQLTR